MWFGSGDESGDIGDDAWRLRGQGRRRRWIFMGRRVKMMIGTGGGQTTLDIKQLEREDNALD